MRRRGMVATGSLWVVAAGLAWACTDSPGDTAFTDACGAPFYGGGATDEAFETMIDAYGDATDGAGKASVTLPTANQTIAASGAAPTFAWTSTLAQSGRRPRALRMAVQRAAAEPALLEEAWQAIARFVVGTARAHLPPITGDIYLVEVKATGHACPVARALTTELSWTPDATAWSALKATNGAGLELVITSAYLSENRVQEGPFRASAGVPFKVQ